MTQSNRNPDTDVESGDQQLIGTLIGDRYRLLELIGHGPLGSVYKARHERMDRIVAVKMMLPQLMSNESARLRFEREARAISRLNHANIIAVHDVGTTPDTEAGYIVMDYIEGETLAAAIRKDGQLGVVRCLPIFLQVCDALEHAHEAGIIHRDLKPANIMLLKQGELEDFVKVVDFGLAKIFAENDKETKVTAAGEILGDVAYISPEQAMGEAIDSRSDIYSLGCVLYEALTGKQPFVGKSAIDIARKHKMERPRSFAEVRPDLYIPEWLEGVVFQALEKDKDKRFDSMQELFDRLLSGANAASSQQQKRRLSTSLRTVGITDEPQAAKESQRPLEATRRGMLPIVVVAALAIAVGAFCLWSTLGRHFH